MGNKSKGFVQIIIIILLLILVGGTAYYLSTFNNKGYFPFNLNQTPKPTIYKPPTQKPSLSHNYPKRQYDISKKFFFNYSYPKVLLDISDENLIGMECTPQYLREIGEEFTFGTNPNIKLTDNTQLQLISKIKNILGKDINTFSECVTNDDRIIVAYEVWGGGGGAANTAYFSLVDNGVVGQAIIIPNDGSPYWTCQKPLQLTTSNKLYYQCGGGDGGYGAGSIYEIDLNTNTSQVLYKCTSLVANEGEQPKTTCQ